jgi:hypothetical protein
MIRALEGIEHAFVKPFAPEFVQLALKFSAPSVIPKVLNNFRKFFKIGLATKAVDGAFYAHNIPPNIERVPGWIIDCESACSWIVDNHTPPVSEGLCKIAANNELVVVNANHTVADGGYLKRVIANCLSDNVEEPALFPFAMKQTYQKEIEKSLQIPPIWFPYNKCSSVCIDPENSQIAPPGTRAFMWSFRVQANQLSCFDKARKKTLNLGGTLWVAKSLSIGTRGKSINPLGIPVIVDLRKYVDQKLLNNACLNNVASVILSVETRPDMTLAELAERFRLDLDRHEKHMSHFYGTTINPWDPVTPNHFYGCSSNMGAVSLKPPLKDFYISAGTHRFDMPSQLFLGTFSRITPFRNELVLQVRFAPSSVCVKDAKIITDSILHCLTAIPMNTTLKAAHQELEAFQAQLDQEY